MDIVVSRGLRWGFTAGFLLACLWIASRIEVRHLVAALAIPPWVFVIGVLLAQQVLGLGGSGSWLVREVTDTSTTLALKAPLLLGGEALAAVIVVVRLLRRRRELARQVASGRRRSSGDASPATEAQEDRGARGSGSASGQSAGDASAKPPHEEPWLF